MNNINGLTNQNIFDIIQMCDNALLHLTYAKTYLSSAGNWGVVDILGGGFISTFAKHSKMGDAQREIEIAKYSINNLKAYLQNINIDNINLGSMDFFTFADYFFDGIIADWFNQSRIREAQRQVDDAIVQLSSLKTIMASYGK